MLIRLEGDDDLELRYLPGCVLPGGSSSELRDLGHFPVQRQFLHRGHLDLHLHPLLNAENILLPDRGNELKLVQINDFADVLIVR
ncbi:hypothetical protein D3C86_1800950 [compost metagenome]